MPRLDGLLESSLYVDDLARSVRFYKKGASADHDGSGQLHVAFAIPAAELAAWEQRLAEHGVPIETRTTWPRGGESLYFRDPDGHLVELATPGVWSIY